jgi:hypothetical protein
MPCWLEDFRAALSFIERSAFHRGENDRGWKADLAWLLKSGKAEELAERATGASPPTTAEEFTEPDELGIRYPVDSGGA